MSSERLVLTTLVKSGEYAKRVIGYLQPEYFELEESRAIFKSVKEYLVKYRATPNRLTIETMIGNDDELDESRTEAATNLLAEVWGLEEPESVDWAVKTTEEWCKDRALYLAINKSISIYQGEDKQYQVSAIPELVRAALGVSFETTLGLDYYDDAERRWEYYTTPENKIPFRIEVLNEVTDGGVTDKSLNIIAAGVNVGKSMCMCALAADYVRSGYDVLYISLEMREELVMQRIDANLLNTDANLLKELGKDRFMSKVQEIRQKSYGRIKVKEYPPSSAHALHFERLLDDYEMLEGFKPRIVIVDYIQICASYKMKSDTGSYYYYKSVAEELRSIAVKRDLVLWTVSQFNRGGADNSDPTMGDTGESFGIPATADGMWAVMRTEELDQIGQLSWKQLKSRYANKAVKTHFMTGVDVNRFQLFSIADGSEKTVRAAIKNDSSVSGQDVKKKFSKLKFGEKK